MSGRGRSYWGRKAQLARLAEPTILQKSPEGAIVATGKRRSASTKRCVVQGTRLGSKRRDMRWLSPDGVVWSSKFEYSVFVALKEQGYNVRKTGPEDSMAYTSTIKGGICSQCGSRAVAQEHRYTPDLFVDTTGRTGAASSANAGYYIEAKGYLRAERRSLLRAFRKEKPACDLRLVVQRDYKVGKSTLTGWATKFLKVPVHVWDGKIPWAKSTG